MSTQVFNAGLYSHEAKAREESIDKLFDALKKHAAVLNKQGFTFEKLGDDVNDLLCDIEGF